MTEIFKMPQDAATSLKSQIEFIETTLSFVKTPMQMAILNSLKELRGIKNKLVEKSEMRYTTIDTTPKVFNSAEEVKEFYNV